MFERVRSIVDMGEGLGIRRAHLPLLVLLTMQRTHHGHWQVDDLADMVTTEEFIPTFSLEDAIVAKRLTAAFEVRMS